MATAPLAAQFEIDDHELMLSLFTSCFERNTGVSVL